MSGEVYKYIGTTSLLNPDLKTQDYNDPGLWVKIGGEADTVYQYMGSGSTIDLGIQDYTDLGYWKEVTATQLFPEGLNVTPSNSTSIGGLVVRNEINSETESFISKANINVTGNTSLLATDNSTIWAIADSTAISSGGSAFGEGKSLAVNGTIATNLILSKANTFITDSNLTVHGDLSVIAKNTSKIDATVNALTSTGAKAVGVTLAFNTIGWKSQNVLFATLDALLGTGIGDSQAAEVKAFIQDTILAISGAVTMIANSFAELIATVTNETTSIASALVNATGKATSGVLASNMINTLAKAFLLFTLSPKIVTINGKLTITAEDTSRIISSSKLVATSSTSNNLGASLVNQLGKTLMNDYRYTTNSGIRTLLREMVRLADDYDSDLGVPVPFINIWELQVFHMILVH
jgi:hypothetical protein